MNQLKKLSFVGGPKDGYYREHPEAIIPNLYLFTINNKTVRYILIDQDDYEALYEYESTDSWPGEWVSYKFSYGFTTTPSYALPKITEIKGTEIKGYEDYVNFSTFNLGGPWPWDKSV